MKIDLSLTNGEVYRGCTIRPVRGGRQHLATPKKQAIPHIRQNVLEILRQSGTGQEVELTGRVPAWVYLVAFDVVRGQFKVVYYNDGTERTQIAPGP